CASNYNLYAMDYW
nr:immunoglobulin heavy chain junction region [Mus musculus]